MVSEDFLHEALRGVHGMRTTEDDHALFGVINEKSMLVEKTMRLY